MADNPSHSEPRDEEAQRAFLLRKLHSLSGVVPVGVFLVEHFWTNTRAMQGRTSYERVDLGAMSFLWVVEFFGILLPLAFHALFGLYLAIAGKVHAPTYPFKRAWIPALSRVSAFVAFAFIAYHVWEFRLAKSFYAMRSEAFYATLVAQLSSTTMGIPIIALIYLVGVAAVVFHFATGVWGFAFSWGFTPSEQARRRSGYAASALGLVLFLLGAQSVLYFATGSRFYFPKSNVSTKGGAVTPCPSPKQ